MTTMEDPLRQMFEDLYIPMEDEIRAEIDKETIKKCCDISRWEKNKKKRDPKDYAFNTPEEAFAACGWSPDEPDVTVEEYVAGGEKIVILKYKDNFIVSVQQNKDYDNKWFLYGMYRYKLNQYDHRDNESDISYPLFTLGQKDLIKWTNTDYMIGQINLNRYKALQQEHAEIKTYTKQIINIHEEWLKKYNDIRERFRIDAEKLAKQTALKAEREKGLAQ